MGILKWLLTGNNVKNAMIDKAIEHLGQEGSLMGTAYREISYDDVVAYVASNDCRITSSTENPYHRYNGWMEFERVLSGQRYAVTLSRTHEGGGSVLTAKKV